MWVSRSRWESLVKKLDMVEMKLDALCFEHGFTVEDGPHIERRAYSEGSEKDDHQSMGAKLFGGGKDGR